MLARDTAHSNDDDSDHSITEIDEELLFDSGVDSHEKQRRTREHKAANNMMFRSKECNFTWKIADNSISYEVAHSHLQTASNAIKDPQLLAHLKTSAIMIKSLYKIMLILKRKWGPLEMLLIKLF